MTRRAMRLINELISIKESVCFPVRSHLRLIEDKDILTGGKADGASPSDFDPDQLDMGTKVEREHSNSDELAREIAMDHLKEDPRYYTKLKLIHKDS